MNFLYLLGPLYLSGWDNNEIRYSLRSLDKAFPVDWLGISGPEIPAFIKDVRHIKVDIDSALGKYKNQQRQLLEACMRPDTPEHLILMNDDFIVRSTPVWPWHTTCRGPIPTDAGKSKWRQTLVDTGTWLQSLGYANPICFEGHTPMPFEKSKAIPVLMRLLANEKSLQFRSAYGNMTGVHGYPLENAKRKDPDSWPEHSPFWSLRGVVSEKARNFLRTEFPIPSQWEV